MDVIYTSAGAEELTPLACERLVFPEDEVRSSRVCSHFIAFLLRLFALFRSFLLFSLTFRSILGQQLISDHYAMLATIAWKGNGKGKAAERSSSGAGGGRRRTSAGGGKGRSPSVSPP